MITRTNIVFHEKEKGGLVPGGGEGDVSTIGYGDWENNSLSQQTSSILSAGGNDNGSYMGELDEEDIAADKEKYFEQYGVTVNGFKCPDEFLSIISPMEFEEIVFLFQKFDINASGTIDKHETKKILHYLNLDYSIDKAEELLAIVDTDKSGEIDFEEFCSFFVMMKRGDERLSKYTSLIENINSTPLGELERQCVFRNLAFSFHIVEIREASLTNPTLYIMEVKLSGMWHRIVDGEITGKYEIRKYQGMGNTLREAKYAAANSALVNMGNAMPGIKFKPGEIPEEWLKWVDDNLLRGVDPGKIVSILASKGFHPHKNTRLMHRIISWISLLKFIESHPYLDVNNTEDPFDEEFLEWIRITANKGIDGSILYELLQDRYIDLTKHHLLFSQKLKNNELSNIVMGKDGIPGNLLDLHYACKAGFIDDVLLYCKCGAAVNEPVVDRHSCERIRPLGYASSYGHAEICRILLQYDAVVNEIDNRGRNALHLAAFHGHKACLEVLIDAGGKLFAGDMQGNTPLHLAAIANHHEVVDYLASRGQELTRVLTSDKVKPKKDATFNQLVEIVFTKLIETKLKANETIRFEKVWLHDAAILLVTLMDDNVKYMLPRSCIEIQEDVLLRFDPRPETGIFINADGSLNQIFVKTIPTFNELSILLKYVYRQAAIDSINHWRRTALHLACDANKINSHEKIIFSLIDKYGCNVNLCDMHKRKAIDLLIMDKIIRDMPSATQAREEMINIKREKMLQELYLQFTEEEKQKIENRHSYILDACIEKEGNMNERLWTCLRQGSILKKRYYHNSWEAYEDPDTGNYFFVKIPEKIDETAIVYRKNNYSNYTWHLPDDQEVRTQIYRKDALTYLMKMKSTLLRKYDIWEVYVERLTQIQYYYNIMNENIRFSLPSCMSWKAILKESTKTGEVLGYAREWEVRTDKYGNTLYRNKITRQCEYNQPLDAIRVQPIESLCTSYQVLFNMICDLFLICF
jgi:hypothetical protein